MRLIQITDLHIGKEGEDTYGVDVRGNFLSVLEAAKVLKPDYLVLSGDLCYRQGERSVYYWIKEQLDAVPVPCFLLSGNHDDPVLMADVFGLKHLLKENELYYVQELNQQKVFFLDTTFGRISEKQLYWLETNLKQCQQDIILFMHHPPMTAQVPYMDRKYALQKPGAIQKVLLEHSHSVSVFTGHYHVDKIIRRSNLLVHITPSCFFQIDQHAEDFQVDHYRIGFREIVVENGTLMNSVMYL